jgi:hypothetical protein
VSEHAWKTMWHKMKGDRTSIKNFCSPDKQLNRPEDLEAMCWLIERVFEKQEKNKLERVNNCVIMPLLDYKKDIPLFSMIKAPLTEWVVIITNRINMRKMDREKFTNLCVPMRVGGEWLIALCDMKNEKCEWIVFNEWNHEKVRFVAD